MRGAGVIVPGQKATQVVLGSAGMAVQRTVVAVLFGAVYIALDWVSYIHPIGGIGITPWGPDAGVAFALLLLAGYLWVPVVFTAVLLSSLFVTSKVPVPVAVSLSASLIIAGGYGACAELLRRLPHFDVRLARPSDLIALLAMALVASGFVAIAVVAIYTAAGIIPPSRFAEAASQFWIGDAIGMAIMTPFLLVLWDVPRKRWNTVRLDLVSTAEGVAQFAGIVAGLALVFGPVGGQEPFKFFYVLFLPLIWIAARQGLIGAAWAVMATQIGLILAFKLRGSPIGDVRSFQTLMYALAVTTLLLGAMVSERRRALKALSESEKYLASILDAVPDGVITVDAAERIQAVNPAVERLFGLTRDRLLGRSVRSLISGPGIDWVLLGPGGRGREISGELIGRRSDDSTFPIELSTGFQQMADQPHRILVVRDITLRQQAETRAQAHQAELARVSRLSVAGQMASALAHELNQPLTATIAYAQGCLRLLRQQPLETELLSEGLGGAVHQASRAGIIINRLREFLYDGSSHQTAIQVSEIVDAVLDLARPEIVQNGIDIRLVIAPDLPRITVDRIQIEQVLLNLVRNSIDAMLGADTRQPRITIAAEAERQAGVRITVSDTGPGVADEIASRLFQPFATTKTRGMGLGLSISQSIVHAHGGDLTMTSNSENGAAFSVTLPGHVGHERE